MKNIKIEIAQNFAEIKKEFSERFLLTWKEFKTENNELVKLMTGKNYTLSSEMIHLYERMAISKECTFESALKRLKNKEGYVLFISEDENFPECEGVFIDGVIHKGKAFKAKASALAELIEYEWNVFLENENAETILPKDLYVFDESMKKAIVFTSDIAFYDEETDEDGIEIETRLCFSCKSRMGNAKALAISH